MKEKAAAREAALKLTIESAGGKLELFNWTVPGSDYSGVTIAEFPDAGTYTAVVSLIEATGAFSEIEAIELLTASEIDRGLGKSPTYRARGAYRLRLIRSLPEPTGEPMKRRSKVGGGPIQGRRPKTPKPTRRNAPKVEIHSKASPGVLEKEVARLARERDARTVADGFPNWE